MSKDPLSYFWNLPRTRKQKAEHRRMRHAWKEIQRKNNHRGSRIVKTILSVIISFFILIIVAILFHEKLDIFVDSFFKVK